MVSTSAPAACSSVIETLYLSDANTGGLSLASMIKMWTIAVPDSISTLLIS